MATHSQVQVGTRIIKLWFMGIRRRQSTLINTLTGHTAMVSLASRSVPDGNTLASASWDSTVRLWMWQQAPIMPRSQDSTGIFVYSVAFSPDGNTLASASWDNTRAVMGCASATGHSKSQTLLIGHTVSCQQCVVQPRWHHTRKCKCEQRTASCGYGM